MFGKKKKKIKELEETVKELEEEVESLKDEKESYKNRFESSEEKRKKLAREKQEREKRINKLEDKLDSYSNKKQETKMDVEDRKDDFREISFEEGLELVKLLDSVEIGAERLITLNLNGALTSVKDYKGLKNTLKAENLEKLPRKGNYFYFTNNNVLNIVLKTRNLFEPGWSDNSTFKTREILEFIQEEKIWVLASSGNSKVVREKNGDCEVLESFKERIDRKHSKGGFSQGRFEKKREEQIRQHLDKVESFVNDLDSENIYLLSDRRHDDFFNNCKYVGGFEESDDLIDSIYNFRVRSFNPF